MSRASHIVDALLRVYSSIVKRSVSTNHPVGYISAETLKAFQGFEGTIISGGTNAGVAGLVGEVADAEGAAEGGPLEVVGYIPRNLPYDQPVDSRYSCLVPSEGLTYGARPIPKTCTSGTGTTWMDREV